MAVFNPGLAIITGGSANIAFTSMWFHSEMNIAFMDAALIKKWVAQLWKEHLCVSEEVASGLIEKPDYALTFFRELKQGKMPKGRVYGWKDTDFPARDLSGIDLNKVQIEGGCGQGETIANE